VCSISPLHHGAYAAVVMCLTPFVAQNDFTSPLLKYEPPSDMNVVGVAKSVKTLRSEFIVDFAVPVDLSFVPHTNPEYTSM